MTLKLKRMRKTGARSAATWVAFVPLFAAIPMCHEFESKGGSGDVGDAGRGGAGGDGGEAGSMGGTSGRFGTGGEAGASGALRDGGVRFGGTSFGGTPDAGGTDGTDRGGTSSIGGTPDAGGTSSTGGIASQGGTSSNGARGGSSAGVGGLSGAGSDAGDGGQAGMDPGGRCRDDETIFPQCNTLGGTTFPAESLTGARAVGVTARPYYGGSYNLVALEDQGHTVALSYGTNALVDFTSWLCFDWIPHPARLAATALTNGHPEIFATTACGKVFVRRLLQPSDIAFWSDWTEFGLPSAASFVTDVGLSVSADHTSHVYVADRGSVYFRHRLTNDSYAAYSGWIRVSSGDFEIVTAGLRDDDRQAVVALDSQGRVSAAVQRTAELGAVFDAWSDLDSATMPALVDVEAVYGTTPLQIYAIDVNGVLHSCVENPGGGFLPWEAWPGPAPSEGLTALAAGATPDGTVLMLTVGESGVVYRAVRSAGTWSSFTIHAP